MTSLPTIDNRKLAAEPERKVRNWRIVAGLLALLAVYGWIGERDREDAALQRQSTQETRERDRESAALQRPVMTQQNKMIGGWV